MPVARTALDPERRAARATGAIKYEAAQPCEQDAGHGTIRYAKNGQCCECMALYRTQYRESRRES